MNDFRKGAWEISYRNAHEIQTTFVGFRFGKEHVDLGFVNDPEHKANAHLIATAGTTATKLAEQGYDAVKVLEALPELLDLIDSRARPWDIYEKLTALRGEL